MMTIAAIGALSAVTALPAMAADVNFYGSARLTTFYNMNTTDAGVDTNGFDEHLQGNSRFGANFKNGDFGGKFEVGTGVNLRLLYGTWNFGSGKLLVGQDYNRYWQCSAQVHADDCGNIGYGSLWDGRQPQLRVDMNNGFYFAAIQPNGNQAFAVAGAVTNDGNQETSDTAGNDSYLPKLNLGYAGKAGNFNYNVGVVGQFYKNKDIDEQITALMGYFTGNAAFGATSVVFNTSYGQNVGNMGFTGRMSYDTGAKENVQGFEGMLQLSQKLSDTLSANVGVGYTYDKSGADGAKTDDKMMIFANMPVKLAKYVSVTPEVVYYNQLDETTADATSDAKHWAVGAKWQIDF
jgi:hypothetical protein